MLLGVDVDADVVRLVADFDLLVAFGRGDDMILARCGELAFGREVGRDREDRALDRGLDVAH